MIRTHTGTFTHRNAGRIDVLCAVVNNIANDRVAECGEVVGVDFSLHYNIETARFVACVWATHTSYEEFTIEGTSLYDADHALDVLERKVRKFERSGR